MDYASFLKIANATATNDGLMPAPAVAKLAALDRPALVAVQNAFLRGGSGVFGEAKTFWDTGDLHGDTYGPIRLIVNGFTSTAGQHILTLRINGLTTNIYRRGIAGTFISASTFGDTAPELCRANATNGLVGSPWSTMVECLNPRSGRAPRTFTVRSTCMDNGVQSVSINDCTYTYKADGEIMTIGVQDDVENGMTALSDWEIVR